SSRVSITTPPAAPFVSGTISSTTSSRGSIVRARGTSVVVRGEASGLRPRRESGLRKGAGETDPVRSRTDRSDASACAGRVVALRLRLHGVGLQTVPGGGDTDRPTHAHLHVKFDPSVRTPA